MLREIGIKVWDSTVRKQLNAYGSFGSVAKRKEDGSTASACKVTSEPQDFRNNQFWSDALRTDECEAICPTDKPGRWSQELQQIYSRNDEKEKNPSVAVAQSKCQKGCSRSLRELCTNKHLQTSMYIVKDVRDWSSYKSYNFKLLFVKVVWQATESQFSTEQSGENVLIHPTVHDL